MPNSKKPMLMTYTEKDIIEKFKIVSKSENRSMSKEIEHLIKCKIEEYEKEHGTITL